MKAFQFKFQSILKIKEQEENRLQEEYALLKKAYIEVQENLKKLISIKEDYLSELYSNEGEGSLDINKALLYRDYLAHLRREIAVTKEEEKRKKQEMEAGYNRLVEKTRERKMLEKLKEKHRVSFISEQLRKIQNELDDLAQGRFNHQKSKDLEADR
ncbi:flagellar export protein FliJ [Anoxybacter fermentans]|uniref:Flagellar FliJ protein n=1 Tax=Anoxybacter fermentans TaxID=1323375 RepID=A0A3S9T023_9FIRM|nr:flagellar export protein FliJ [Anoxybacter fermentans]AZR73877.1 flagellar export protein FliJ [Anoxybacter fermentans]